MNDRKSVRCLAVVAVLAVATNAAFAAVQSVDKNDSLPADSSLQPVPAATAALPADAATVYPLQPISCGVVSNWNWATTSTTLTVIRECRLWVPDPGRVLISADGSLGLDDTEYEAHFRIGIDDPAGDATIDRWVNIYTDGGDGTDEGVAVSALLEVPPGWHTFFFVGSREAGTGTVLVHDPTLTVTFIPAGLSALDACGAHGEADWTSASSSYTVVRSCSMTVPHSGRVLISANGTAARTDGEYEANFRVDIDGIAGNPDFDRWVNVYNDSGDGSDRTVAVTAMLPVLPGGHDFYFVGRRAVGTGTAFVYDPSLSVLFIPDLGGYPVSCSAAGNLSWTTTSSTFEIVRQCTLVVPESSAVFITADATVGRQDGEFEARLEIGIDSTAGDAAIDRWVNVYNDTGDGSDNTFALSALRPIPAGVHTVYLLAARYSGTGTVKLYDPVLNVVQVDASLFLDNFETGNFSAWSSHTP